MVAEFAKSSRWHLIWELVKSPTTHATGFVIIDKKTSNMALVMDWTTTTCMAMGYLFFCNYCVCKCNNTILSDSRTPNIPTKYSTKAFGGTPILGSMHLLFHQNYNIKTGNPTTPKFPTTLKMPKFARQSIPLTFFWYLTNFFMHLLKFGLKFGSRLSHWKLHLPTSTQYGHEFILRLLCGILPYQYV